MMNSTSPSQQPIDSRGGMWIVLQFGTLLGALIVGPLWGGHWEAEPGRTIGRWLLIVSGVIALAGFLALGRNLTPHPKPRTDGTLVRHGIYRLIRHPLYSSLVVGAVGWALLWQSIPALACALLLAWVLNAKASVEEHWLAKQFPDYAEYARHTRRFIPWIY
jgi:protein-S-isoprenylcysteine O-methyltransferase Ste14